jgi:hypothetical protein
MPGSIPLSICPNSKPLYNNAGNKEGSYVSEGILPPNQRIRIKQGQFLGRVGCRQFFLSSYSMIVRIKGYQPKVLKSTLYHLG